MVFFGTIRKKNIIAHINQIESKTTNKYGYTRIILIVFQSLKAGKHSSEYNCICIMMLKA